MPTVSRPRRIGSSSRSVRGVLPRVRREDAARRQNPSRIPGSRRVERHFEVMVQAELRRLTGYLDGGAPVSQSHSAKGHR